eukprot:TRINITY_DN4710_c0_g1_i1.p1 TRINITY_DN4710_c0_g1~~TRINITY_DN4710_c0_g1_i1.p1  ORF type:complete len:125 (-),score=20.00 TRINITY_DN4710_c0_g1_i1:18-392(-)
MSTIDVIKERDDFRRTTNRIEITEEAEKALSSNEFIDVVQRMRRFRFPAEDSTHLSGHVTVNRKKIIFQLFNHPRFDSLRREDNIKLSQSLDRINLSLEKEKLVGVQGMIHDSIMMNTERDVYR